MASTVTDFDPTSAGLRVADSPITRKPRRPSSKPGPKPQYADAVWFSFQKGHPLEATVSPRSVEDTIRRLKAAARYLERVNDGVEVRVQISVEPEMADGQPTKKSVVKFLGHEPWVLGRRVAKVAAGNGAQAADAREPAPPPRAASPPRRTVAVRRSARGRGHRAR